MYRCGVSNVIRGENGTKYYLTNDAGYRVATADVANGVYGIRDRFDEPVAVGSRLYVSVHNAIARYEMWASQH